MDFSPGVLFAGLLVGMIGMGLMLHGKRASNPRSLCVGLVMCAFPAFVHSPVVMLGVAAACLAGLYAMHRFA